VAYAPKWLHETKLAAGIGIFHDTPSLGIFGRQDQVSYSTFYDPGGQISAAHSDGVPGGSARPAHAEQPHRQLQRERKLPLEFYGKASYIVKQGRSGFTFAPDAAGGRCADS